MKTRSIIKDLYMPILGIVVLLALLYARKVLFSSYTDGGQQQNVEEVSE